MAKKKSASSEQKLKATVTKLRADLKQAEGKRASWKKRASKAEAAVADLQTQLRRADEQAKLEASRASAPAASPAASTAASPAASPAASAAAAPATAATSDVDPSTSDAPPSDAASGPDASWTVLQLRAEAKRRGISGLSGKPKAELVKALA